MVETAERDGLLTAERCELPAAVLYDCLTPNGIMPIIRCEKHDPETKQRWLAHVGGLVARKEINQ